MNRKDDHIKNALKQEVEANDFDKVRFIHNAIPGIAVADINLETSFCGMKIKYPIYINAMTGGSDKAFSINNKLSMLANHFSIPIASGSLSPILRSDEHLDSFKIIRDNNPNGIVMANLGADKNYSDATKAISLLNADVMQIHLNAIQEIVMPEGDRDFRDYEKNIKEIVDNLNIPVLVKEVGFGMSSTTLNKLKTLGVRYVDISGKGGTNFSKIENARRTEELSYFSSYGLSTVESLLEARDIKDIEIYASGGVRNAMDIIKALALGAKAVGMSSYFLRLVTNNPIEDSIKKVDSLIYELKSIMTILGKKTTQELRDVELIYSSELLNFIEQRKKPV